MEVEIDHGEVIVVLVTIARGCFTHGVDVRRTKQPNYVDLRLKSGYLVPSKQGM